MANRSRLPVPIDRPGEQEAGYRGPWLEKEKTSHIIKLNRSFAYRRSCRKDRQCPIISGTIFASRKMDFTDLLAAICIIVNGAKGVSTVQLSRDLDCQYKTAWVLAHKLREAMTLDVHIGEELDGEVEIDGAFFGGKIRLANIKEKRVDRRLAKHQTGTRRAVVALRERLGRTLAFVRKLESEGAALAIENVARTAIMAADEASHWDMLQRWLAR